MLGISKYEQHMYLLYWEDGWKLSLLFWSYEEKKTKQDNHMFKRGTGSTHVQLTTSGIGLTPSMLNVVSIYGEDVDETGERRVGGTEPV